MTQASAVICDQCEHNKRNSAAIEYFNTSGVELSYIESTIVYDEAWTLRQSSPVTPSSNGRVKPCIMFTLMQELKDKSTLYSLEYDDNRMFPIYMKKSFFGLWDR